MFEELYPGQIDHAEMLIDTSNVSKYNGLMYITMILPLMAIINCSSSITAGKNGVWEAKNDREVRQC